MDDTVKDIYPKRGVTVFRNLIHLEFGYANSIQDWVEVSQMLKCSPSLQIFVIDKVSWVRPSMMISLTVIIGLEKLSIFKNLCQKNNTRLDLFCSLKFILA